MGDSWKSTNQQNIKTNKAQIRLFSIREYTKFWWFDSRFLHDVTNFDACIKSKRNLEILEFLENPSQKWGDIKIPFFHRYDDVAFRFVHKENNSFPIMLANGKNIDAAFYLINHAVHI